MCGLRGRRQAQSAHGRILWRRVFRVPPMQDWACRPACFSKSRARCIKSCDPLSALQITPSRVLAGRAIKIGRFGYGRRRELFKWISGKATGRNGLIDQLVDEGRVGAVFQEPAHKVGQQVLMHADGRVDAAPRVVAGFDQFMNWCRPPSRAIRSAPGRSIRW